MNGRTTNCGKNILVIHLWKMLVLGGSNMGRGLRDFLRHVLLERALSTGRSVQSHSAAQKYVLRVHADNIRALTFE